MKNQNLLIVALGLVFAVTLQAEKPEKPQGPCKADIEKFCKDVPHRDGKLMACLKQNEANLSAECKAKRNEMKEERKNDRKEERAAFRKACKDDVKKLCADAAKGPQGVRACMKEKAAQASPACQAELAKLK
ncbi:MAG: cysteine rich repeat-containing protein [Spirochaetia bacterium]|nr:cysteine rich repeat-containing protein [Spirochaetia bacterium]